MRPASNSRRAMRAAPSAIVWMAKARPLLARNAVMLPPPACATSSLAISTGRFSAPGKTHALSVNTPIPCCRIWVRTKANSAPLVSSVPTSSTVLSSADSRPVGSSVAISDFVSDA